MKDTEGSSGFGREVPIVWNRRKTVAWVPGLLCGREFPLSVPTGRAVERATTICRTASADAPASWEVLARLTLRSEGAASSAIEGVHAGYSAIALAQRVGRVSTDAETWVADNLAALHAALDHAAGVSEITLEDLNSWHELLMRSSALPVHMIGRVRTEQGWIGGSSPFDAALVTPPPEFLEQLLTDLLDFCNRGSSRAPAADSDGVASAAIAHAQFETIHPYADGNGRLGRILLLWMVTRELRLTYPPALSVRLERNRGAYLSGLTLFQGGSHDQWIRSLADMLTEAAHDMRRVTREVEQLLLRWVSAVEDLRVDSAAVAALALIPRWVVLDANLVASSLDVSTRAARGALARLVSRGVLQMMELAKLETVGRPSPQYVSPELLRILAAN